MVDEKIWLIVVGRKRRRGKEKKRKEKMKVGEEGRGVGLYRR